MQRKETTSEKDTVVRDEARCSDGITYHYRLTVHESGHVSAYRLPLYSVSAEMCFPGEETPSRAELRDCFSDAGKAIVFFDKVVEHLATPIDLRYIMEDEMS